LLSINFVAKLMKNVKMKKLYNVKIEENSKNSK